MKLTIEVIVLLILAFVLMIGIDTTGTPPSDLKDHFIKRGVEETGAINIVSSIYLGYRVFDTLGETIVLLLSVSGIITLLEIKK